MRFFSGICTDLHVLANVGMATLRFTILNVIVFAIGFISNLEGGFQKSLAFPCAKAEMDGRHVRFVDSGSAGD